MNHTPGKIRLAALDMDGTLFNNKLEITPKTQAAIKAAIASGAQVVISTGRPYIGLPVDTLTELGIRYAITANGSAIYRLPEKECIFSNCMRPETVAQSSAICRQRTSSMMLSSAETATVRSMDKMLLSA